MYNKIKFENSYYVLSHKDSLFNANQIEKIEQEKEAKYLGEFSIKDRLGNWANQPVAVFYQKEKYFSGSRYFGLYYRPINLLSEEPPVLMICDAASVEEPIYTGVLNARAGEVLYSAYRHDYQSSPEDGVFIDGGRDYTKHYLTAELVKFKIENGQFFVLTEEHIKAN